MPLYSPKRRPSFGVSPTPRLTEFASVLSAEGASGSTCWARALPNAASIAAAIPVILSAACVFMVLSPESPLVVEVGRVVRAVDVGVAVHAAARDRVRGGARAGKRAGGAAVARRLVALLAEERLAQLEQVRVGRPVRVVADAAVLLHRLVGAHEGAALLHVAHVAGVVDVVAHHHAGTDRAVRVVAVRARHHAFADRVARGPVDHRPDVLVAGEAHVGLGELVAHRVARGVQLVAGRARDVAALVLAALPVDAGAALMAGQADLVLLRGGHLAEAPRHGIGGALDVLGRVAVAHHAADADGRAAVGLGAVLARPDEMRVGVTVGAVLAAADVLGGRGLGEGARGKAQPRGHEYGMECRSLSPEMPPHAPCSPLTVPRILAFLWAASWRAVPG